VHAARCGKITQGLLEHLKRHRRAQDEEPRRSVICRRLCRSAVRPRADSFVRCA